MTPGPIMIGLQGLTLSPEEQELLRHPLVGGVILFTRNYASVEQLAALTGAVRDIRFSLIIGVDHEGGRVQRFREGFTRLPALRRLGDLYDRDKDLALALARQHAWLMATELRAAGIDLSFAPVLDLDRGLNAVVGDRAFHHDPRIVTGLALAYTDGMRQAGMASVAKHFPGHGGVTLDSHHDIPVDKRSYAEIENSDLLPFVQLIKNGIAAIMPAHIIFSAVDERPAGFSPYWLNGVLRQRLGFKGAVVSDDMGMAGAAWAGEPAARAQTALDAGVDLILACNERAAAVAMLEGLKNPPDGAARQRLAMLRGRGDSPADLQANANWQQAVRALAALA